MFKATTKSADTIQIVPGNTTLASSAGVLEGINFVERLNAYIGAPRGVSSIVAFSRACKATHAMSSDFLIKHTLKSLLTAVVEGNEALANKIIRCRPELLLDASATVTDLSGKEIKNLTPLQAAICAGDTDMVQMIKEVLQQKLQIGITLSFNPELEIQRQIATIYPNGDINAIEAAQIATAQAFKTSMLEGIFTVINAATAELVKNEIDTPGQNNPDSQLNIALHTFRAQFATTVNSEQIFNPFYLLKAFEFYDEQFDNFRVNPDDIWSRRSIFWCQIIGYIQRHLPACLLQAFAQGIYDIRENKEKLNRDFNFRYGEGSMRAFAGDLNNLGYKWAVARGQRAVWVCCEVWGGPAAVGRCVFKIYCEQKNQVWRTYEPRITTAATPELLTDSVRSRVIYSFCNIC